MSQHIEALQKDLDIMATMVDQMRKHLQIIKDTELLDSITEPVTDTHEAYAEAESQQDPQVLSTYECGLYRAAQRGIISKDKADHDAALEYALQGAYEAGMTLDEYDKLLDRIAYQVKTGAVRNSAAYLMSCLQLECSRRGGSSGAREKAVQVVRKKRKGKNRRRGSELPY